MSTRYATSVHGVGCSKKGARAYMLTIYICMYPPNMGFSLHGDMGTM